MTKFYKYQGTGNDFVLIDGRKGDIDLKKKEIKAICDRRFGVGADGLIILKTHKKYDFEMLYYNADGAPSSMCGNGGRCIVAFAKKLGIIKNEASFLAVDGPHEGIIKKGQVQLKMTDVNAFQWQGVDLIIDTGSPHYLKFIRKTEVLDVVNEGRAIRNSEQFKKEGINVNFILIKGKKKIDVRTYERGVEDETYSCGTGVTAAALAYVIKTGEESAGQKISINTLGGDLEVHFNRKAEQVFTDIWLCGAAELVYTGNWKND